MGEREVNKGGRKDGFPFLVSYLVAKVFGMKEKEGGGVCLHVYMYMRVYVYMYI